MDPKAGAHEEHMLGGKFECASCGEGIKSVGQLKDIYMCYIYHARVWSWLLGSNVAHCNRRVVIGNYWHKWDNCRIAVICWNKAAIYMYRYMMYVLHVYRQLCVVYLNLNGWELSNCPCKL